jgi:hypothetical protein
MGKDRVRLAFSQRDNEKNAMMYSPVRERMGKTPNMSGEWLSGCVDTGEEKVRRAIRKIFPNL